MTARPAIGAPAIGIRCGACDSIVTVTVVVNMPGGEHRVCASCWRDPNQPGRSAALAEEVLQHVEEIRRYGRILNKTNGGGR